MDITIANAAKIIILIFVIVIKKINNWIAKDKNKNDWKKIFFDGNCGTYGQKKRLPKSWIGAQASLPAKRAWKPALHTIFLDSPLLVYN
jgi:hypothetical protein